MKDFTVGAVDTCTLPIHHRLLAKPGFERASNTIASHEQALKQARAWRAAHFPNAATIETCDTAHAAKMLAEGQLEETVAVVCRKDAAMLYGLSLVAKNIEDTESIMTFRLLSLRSDATSNF